MKIDILIKYVAGNITVISEKLNIAIYEPSMVLLMRNEGEADEKIESVGVSANILREEMKKYPEYNKNKIFRFCDPFDIESFDPFVSACIISFYKTKMQHLHLETVASWKKLFIFYKVDLTIFIPGYFSLSDDAKSSLMKHLKMNRVFNPIFV